MLVATCGGAEVERKVAAAVHQQRCKMIGAIASDGRTNDMMGIHCIWVLCFWFAAFFFFFHDLIRFNEAGWVTDFTKIIESDRFIPVLLHGRSLE